MSQSILLVDDEAANLRSLQRTLAGEGELLTASNGAQALQMLASHGAAMVVTDQRMPDLLGTELLEQAAAQFPHTVRVLLTGYTDTETLLAAINAGHVFYYLTKPWSPQELRLVVRRGIEHFEAQRERERLHAELAHACAGLRREAELKARLLTLAAHELGTPLHVVGASLEMLAAVQLEPQAEEWLRMGERNVRWLARGLAQMLAAGRWRQQNLPLRPQVLPLATLLQTLREAHATVLQHRRLALDWQIDGALPAIAADVFWVTRALTNLVSNAIRFTADGGRVEVAAGGNDAFVHIEVSDTGVGIAAELLDEVFEPFSAAGGELLRHGSGTWEFGARGLGLGLATAKAIIEQHGGSIEVRSVVGRGSCFRVTLPVSSGVAGAPPKQFDDAPELEGVEA